MSQSNPQNTKKNTTQNSKTKVNADLSRRDLKYVKKKAQVTEKYFGDIIAHPDMSDKKLRKDLEGFVKNIVKLELKQEKIPVKVKFLEMTKEGTNASTRKTKKASEYEIRINYNNIMQEIRACQTQEELEMVCTQFMQTCLHECTHVEQRYYISESNKSKNITPEYGYKYSLEFLVKEKLGKEYYKKGENYWNMLFERDARLAAFLKSSKITNELSQSNFSYEFFDTERILSLGNDTTREQNALSDQYGNYVDREDLNNQFAAELIKDEPELLDEYPLLKDAFNKDGSRKALYQTIQEAAAARGKIKLNPFIIGKNRKEKLKDVQDLYGEIFYETLGNFATEKDINLALKMVGKRAFKTMLTESQKHYENQSVDMRRNIKYERELYRRFPNDKLPHEIDYMYNQKMNFVALKEQEVKGNISAVRSLVTSKPITKMKLANIMYQESKDKERIELNYQRKTSKQYSQKQNVRSASRPVYDLAEAEVNEKAPEFDESQLNSDLIEARSLSKLYKDLESSERANFEEVKSIYYALEKENKEKEIGKDEQHI